MAKFFEIFQKKKEKIEIFSVRFEIIILPLMFRRDAIFDHLGINGSL